MLTAVVCFIAGVLAGLLLAMLAFAVATEQVAMDRSEIGDPQVIERKEN